MLIMIGLRLLSSLIKQFGSTAENTGRGGSLLFKIPTHAFEFDQNNQALIRIKPIKINTN